MNNEKLPCSVIEDLIPLCKEGLCSGESRAIVEEHIAGCDNCRALYESLEPPSVAELSAADEKKPFSKVNVKLKRSRLKVIILSVLLAVIVLPLLFLTAGQMFRRNGWISFETIIQNFEAERIADAFANGDIDLFADYFIYGADNADKSFWDNLDKIEENDRQTMKELYSKCFTDDYVITDRQLYTTYEHGIGDVTSFMYFQYYSEEKNKWLGIGFEIFKPQRDYYKYNIRLRTQSFTPDEDDTAPDDYENFIDFMEIVGNHDIDEFDSIERFITDDPLGTYDTGGGKWVHNDDGTYTETPSIYDPKITYLGQYFAPEDRDHIVQSMTAFLEKGYKILNCAVSDPCYDPDRQMLYYNVAVTAVDTDGNGLAVLQARMFYDYRGIYQPEVYSVAPNNCSAELITDIQHFFGYELLEPVLTSKTDDLTDAKAVLDEQGIRCRIQTAVNVVTGEYDYNLMTSDEDAPEASDILSEIYYGNSEYECYVY